MSYGVFNWWWGEDAEDSEWSWLIEHLSHIVEDVRPERKTLSSTLLMQHYTETEEFNLGWLEFRFFSLSDHKFDVDTVEGIANGEELHPLQEKFIEHAALQCGICTPGILVATKSLLEKHPNPSETQVRYWLAGNLCRCTGYDKIVRAVMETAADLRKAS